MIENIVLFCINQENYFAFKTRDILWIEPAVALVKVPEMPPEMIGYINVAGQYGPVFDLTVLFGAAPLETVPDDFVILFKIDADSFGGIQVHHLPTTLDAELTPPEKQSQDHFFGIANTGEVMALVFSPAYFADKNLPPIPPELLNLTHPSEESGDINEWQR